MDQCFNKNGWCWLFVLFAFYTAHWLPSGACNDLTLMERKDGGWITCCQMWEWQRKYITKTEKQLAKTTQYIRKISNNVNSNSNYLPLTFMYSFELHGSSRLALLVYKAKTMWLFSQESFHSQCIYELTVIDQTAWLGNTVTVFLHYSLSFRDKLLQRK